MQLSWLNLAKTVALVAVWIGVLTTLASWWVQRGVTPQFPYYPTLLKYAGDARGAIWGYFDGVYYLILADKGYVDTGTQAFFPVYPLLLRGLASLTHLPLFWLGRLVSIVSLALAAIIWIFAYRGPRRNLILTLLYPTAFFFLMVYTESLFFLLTVLFFSVLKARRFSLAAIVAGVASGTRIIGIFLLLPLLFACLKEGPRGRSFWLKCLLMIGVGSSGLLLYSFYLSRYFGDPLLYLHVQGMFGAERASDHLVLLPQVLYRYARMLLTVDIHSWLYQRVWLELLSFGSALWLLGRYWRERDWGLNSYLLAALLLPTLTGTLSSLPRYTLILWPFLLPRQLKTHPALLIGVISTGLFLYLGANFVRGMFIS